MKITEELEYQSEHLQWLDQKLKVALPVDASNYQSVACFDMTIEHVGSMLLLTSSELYGSMLALTRVAFESLAKKRGRFIFSDPTCMRRGPVFQRCWLSRDIRDGIANEPVFGSEHAHARRDWRQRIAEAS